jgi:ribosome-binding protein aMBF1 (putative translation factor)
MSYQDWEEVNIGNKNSRLKHDNLISSKVQNVPGSKNLSKLESEEIFTLPKIDYNISKELVELRNMVKKKDGTAYGQKDLAQALNYNVTVIKDLESGKSNNNKGLINKVRKHLDNLIKKK